DPEMTDELRVTVVVTGLGKGAVSGSLSSAETAVPATAAAQILKTTKNDGTLDYTQLERPTYMRNDKSRRVPEELAVEETQRDIEYFDIPAFLRRQEEES
ncbi:MAG TPA: cell division protein FtsZ, partial [Coxiellaceae bacterium]|nr:cell division protein FtsZ [Coxiellaceae bacterium]